MTQLTMLSGNTTMYAEFSVTESVVESMVQEGMKATDVDEYIAKLPDATFVMKNGTEYPHKGRVVSLTGVVNAETGSLTSKVSFPNPDGHLYSGIQGTIVMNFAEKGVIVIPQFAVVRLQDKSMVYKVQADSTATGVDVTVEDTGNGKDFIVTSGLNAGDRIIAVGANNVVEGQKVLFPEEVKNEE
jgi:membrane fusion protein (multidrug efflux system)